MSSTNAVLLKHPDLVPVYLASQAVSGENAQGLGDVVLAHLASAGVTGHAAREALRVLIVYANGYAAFATGCPPPDSDGDWTRRPLSSAELEGNFSRGLRWTLVGITSASSQDFSW